MSVVAQSPSLGELLVADGLVTPDVVESATTRAHATGERLTDALVGLGVSSDDVLRTLARQQGLPYLSPDELPTPLPVLKNLSPKNLNQYPVGPVSAEG